MISRSRRRRRRPVELQDWAWHEARMAEGYRNEAQGTFVPWLVLHVEAVRRMAGNGHGLAPDWWDMGALLADYGRDPVICALYGVKPDKEKARGRSAISRTAQPKTRR